MGFSIKGLDMKSATEILKAEEGHFLDFKAKEITPGKLSEAVSAFANTAWWELYIWIEEIERNSRRRKNWSWFSNVEEANAHIQIVESMSPLWNHYDVEFLTHEGWVWFVMHLTIFKSKDILFATNKKAYIRRSAMRLPIETDEQLQRLKLDKGIVSFEDETINDLASNEITKSAIVVWFIKSVVPMADDAEKWLLKQRVISNGLPTVAWVLLFSDEPQAILPKRSAVKIYRYITKSEGERDTLAFDPLTIEWAIYPLIYSTVGECKKIVESIKKLGTSGLEMIEYPEEALHEIITNAVLHRDYSIASDVHVRIFDNRIEIVSPWRFPWHVTEKNILEEQFARNPKLVRLINKFPNPPNKDVWEGLNTAKEAMEKLRLKPPIIEEKENTVRVTLKHESLGSPEQIVMEYMESHDEITNAIGREITGIKSENTMKNVFYRLRDKWLLELQEKKAWKKTRVFP